MPTSTRPRNWDRIVLHIKTRAEDRCECGAHWDCGSALHPGRCNSREGRRDPINRRKEVKLRVVQIGPPDNWSPDYLIALCNRCWQVWEDRRLARLVVPEQEVGLW